MPYRNPLGYLMLPAMMAVVTTAACAPRQPTKDQASPSAMKKALSYKAPFGEVRTAPPKSSQRVKRSTKVKGVVLSVTGSAAKATGVLRICRYPTRHAISQTAPFRKSGKMGNCFGLSNTAIQAQRCNHSFPGCCRKRKGGRSWPMSAHFAPNSRSITLVGPSASRGTGSVTPSMRRRMRA